MRKIGYVLLLVFWGIAFNVAAQTSSITGDSEINKCETKSYTISIQNTSGNPLTQLVIDNNISLLTGFSYITGTTSMNVTGNPGFSCTAEPTGGPTHMIWNMDTQCGGPFTLANGQTLNITFSLQTDCNAVSASMNVHTTYLNGGTPAFQDTAFSIRVLPGGVTIKKTPNVIPQYVGQDVNWTLTIENSGLGIIENVVVTDMLGAGLGYVGSSPAGSNLGQTTTWGPAQVPAFVSMVPGQIVTINVTAHVNECQNLENTANVRWGCDLTPAGECFNTATDGGTATASVERIPRTPLIQYTPPNVDFTYCTDYVDVSFPVINVGDGDAYNVRLQVNFGALIVSNISGGVTYDGTQFIIANPIPPLSQAPLNRYMLSFRLTYAAWCGGGFPTGSLLWQTVYEDECHNEFYPPVEFSTLNAPADATSLAVTKSGGGVAIQIGDQVTYNITSAHNGPLSCGTGSGGQITVTDTVPNGFTVVDAGGGTWTPGAGGTGGTIVWTYMPPATLNTNITLQAPDRTQCETYCFTYFTNTVTATSTDCCGCQLNASASQTTAIECEELVNSEKTAVPVTTERCETIEYTNTYDFGSAGILLNRLTFTEYAENQQQYVPGSLTVAYDGADITGCVLVTDTTPGGNLSLDFSGCAADMVNNKNLTIVYRLTITEATVSACSGTTFYSWSSLDMGPTGSQCLGDGVIEETTQVSVEPPAMSLSITGLDAIVDKCETQTITMTLTQTSSTVAEPRDVRLVLSGLNYFVVNPAATVCSGDVSPTSCTPTIVGGDYVWEFGDGFVGAGSQAVFQLTVQKRCAGIGDLVGTAYYDDNCNDDSDYDNMCSVTATAHPTLLLSADLLIEKTPEVYYAQTNTIVWAIYVTNRGTGTAYNVWVDDVLGSGLDYVSAVVDDATATVTADLNHSGGGINGATISIPDMTPGERRKITFTALLISCTDLTNVATTSWGCISGNCQTPVSDNSVVVIRDPLVINTNLVTTPIAPCADPKGNLTLKNAGQTTAYNLRITEILPAGLLYVSGTTRWRVNGGSWNGPNASYNPNPTVSPLSWSKTEIPALASFDPGDTIEIEFDLHADCPFQGGLTTVSTSYENPCGRVFTADDSRFNVILNQPIILLRKIRNNVPIGCNELVEWTIEVENRSGYTLPFIWVEDTLGGGYTFASSAGDPPYTSDDGTYTGGRVRWELQNVKNYVNNDDIVSLTLRATSDSSPCNSDLTNTVRAWWGCGAVDGSSATKPGVNPPDNTSCLATWDEATGSRVETRQPSVGFLTIALDPTSINSCDDSVDFSVVLANPGPTDAIDVDLVVTLPAGLSYLAGTSEVCVGTDGTCSPTPRAEPTVAGNQLIYDDINLLTGKATNIANVIQANGGNDTLVLHFSVASSCYVTSDVGLRLYYYDCCGDTQYSTNTIQTVTALYPNLAVTKTPTSSQIACGAQQTWTIRVDNTGNGNAQVVRIEDTPDSWITVEPAASTVGLIDMGGGVWGWEITDLAAGSSQVFTLVGTLNSAGNDCTTSLRQNNVRAIWGCGTTGDAIDNDPTTTAYDCTYTTWSNAPVATLQMPDLRITGMTPSATCNSGSFDGYVDVTVQNQGDGVVFQNFTVTVSEGAWSNTATYNVGTSGNILPNQSRTIRVELDPVGNLLSANCFSCRAYNFTVTIDSANDICECNETNNTGTPTYNPCSSLGDLVWYDTNGNGIQDGGTETGIGGVTVNLYSSNGTFLTTEPTVGGNYLFDQLFPGSYFVEFDLTTLPLDYAVTLQDQGGNNSVDSDADRTTGRTVVITLPPATHDPTWDMGVYEAVAIGNRIWLDTGAGTSNNGMQDGGELGVGGVTVQLYISGGTLVQTTTTDGNGNYWFNNLPAGQYYVQIPASEFVLGRPLYQYTSSWGAGNNEITDQDGDENGQDTTDPRTQGVRTQVYILQPGLEQTGEDQDAYPGALSDNHVNGTADFGFVPGVAIGNRVWVDDGTGGGVTNDGIQNGTEPGRANVTVELYTSTGTLVRTTTTDGSGNYWFDNLPPGQYYVQIPANEFLAGGDLVGYASSVGAGTNETADQLGAGGDENGQDTTDPCTTGVRTQVYDLQPTTEQSGEAQPVYPGFLPDNSVNGTADFGFVSGVAIGNRVWYDTNNNGRQDGAEVGVNGVDVWLYRDVNNNNIAEPGGADGSAIRTTTTDASGNYWFDNLPPGRYFVQIPSTEFALGQPLYQYASSFGAGANETTDQTNDENGQDTTNPSTAGVNTQVYNLQPGTEQTLEAQPAYPGSLPDNSVNATADLGFVPGVAIGNRVWLDTGVGGGVVNNGIQDGTEPGVPNVTVELRRTAGGTLIRTTTTDANGNYWFDNVPPGQYYVQIPAAEFLAGGDLIGYASSFGAGTNETTDQTGDENGRDTTDPRTAGVRTQDYTLQPTTEQTGEDQSAYPGVLGDSSVNGTADFGFAPGVAIGNRVWLDTGTGGGTVNNGIQDGGELGRQNVTVELYTSVGTLVRTTITAATGNYWFDNLPPGQYYVQIPAAEFLAGGDLIGYASSFGAGMNKTTDQLGAGGDENGQDTTDPRTAGVRTQVYDLQPDSEPTTEAQPAYPGLLDDNNVNGTADFGFVLGVAIGNRVWLDTGTGGGVMNNGIQDGGELGVANVTVQLYTTTGTLLRTTTTDANGNYWFDNLPPGQYYVQIPAAEFLVGGDLIGYASSFGAGTNETTDQVGAGGDENGQDTTDPRTAGVRTQVYDLQPTTEQSGEAQPVYPGSLPDNSVNGTADFGFIAAVAIGNRVWLDDGTGGGTVNNGIQDGGELGVANVTVELRTSGGTLVRTTTTDANGNYWFDNLPPGQYYVQIPAAEFLAGGDLIGYASSFGAGTNESTDQAGDENGQDTTDPHTAGVRTQVYDLQPGTEQTGENQMAYPGILGDNSVNGTADFGVTPGVAIGNRVWLDDGTGGGTMNNRIQDGGELGGVNVIVELYTSAGVLVRTTITDGSGNYWFDNLPPGTYYVQIPASEFDGGATADLTGYASSFGVGANESTDQTGDENGQDTTDPRTAGVRTQDYTLQPTTEQTGEDQMAYSGVLGDDSVNGTADFGFTPGVAIGNRVWVDNGNGGGVANDGIQNGTEPIVAGVGVQLYQEGDTPGVTMPLRTTTTNLNGNYWFDNLPPGRYFVHIPASEFGAAQPLYQYASSHGAGSDETTDQSGDENGQDTTDPLTQGVSTQVYELQPGAEPNGEPQPDYPGMLANTSVNGTADFGFTPGVAVGNRVWMDDGTGGGVANDGIQNGGELGVTNVTVELRTSGGTLVRTTTTDGSGNYWFDNLPPGQYYVQVPAAEFLVGGDLIGYASSLGAGTNETDDQTGAGTRDENGQDTTDPRTAGVRTQVYDLQPTTEQTGEAQPAYPGLLSDNSVNATADFGFVEGVAIGNRVWLDDGTGGGVANNGMQDGGESGVAGVDVWLYCDVNNNNIPEPGAADGSPVRTTQTDGNGNYVFDNLPPGRYFVQIPSTEFANGQPLYRYTSSFGAGTDELTDQTSDENGADTTDPVANGVNSQVYNLQPNTEQTGEDQSSYTGILGDNNVNFTADFGFLEGVAIGNRIWFDTGVGANMNNGRQDAGETGVSTVDVWLFQQGQTPGVDTPVRTTQTDANGNYVFDNVPPGNYFAHIPASEFGVGQPLYRYVSSRGAGNDESTDQNGDENGQDSATILLMGISMQVYILQPHTEQTGEDQSSYAGALIDDSVNFTADFGFVEGVAIGNHIWFDTGVGTANNGMQDVGEAGVNTVDVWLFRQGQTPGVNSPVRMTQTDANGNYVFDNLDPGQYFVYIPPTEFGAGQPLFGYVSSRGAGTNETTDQPASGGDENGIDDALPGMNGIRSQVYDLQPNLEQTAEDQSSYAGTLDDDNVNFTADFGFVEGVAIGNRIWFDTGVGTANNGIQDVGEFGVSTVDVWLYRDVNGNGIAEPGGADGSPVRTTQTDVNGNYAFDQLDQGQYFVQIPATEFGAGQPLFGYASSFGAGTDETTDQTGDENGADTTDPVVNGVSTQVYDLQPNTEQTGEDQISYAGSLDDNNVNFTADFGFVEGVAIGNRIWYDTGAGGGTANNGIQDGSELGVASLDVALYRSGQTPGIDTPIRTTITDGTGNYVFDNVPPGSYFVYVPPSEFASGQPLYRYVSSRGAGADETTDQAADENGIDDAVPGTNGIRSQVYDLQPNSEQAGEDQASYAGNLDDDNVNFTADFGFVEGVAIGNRVWFDTGAGANMNNGRQDGGETGVSTVDVWLYRDLNSNGIPEPGGADGAPVRTMQTDGSGNYQFDNLDPGRYFVHIPPSEFGAGQPLFGYASSFGAGTDETTDQTGDENGRDTTDPLTDGVNSQVYELQPNTETITDDEIGYTGNLDDDNVNFTADFGFVEGVAIGNRIWYDTGVGAANNGIQDGGESGVPGLDVALYRSGDTPGVDAPVRMTVTDGSGSYVFDNLPPGQYFVYIPPSEFVAGQSLNGYVSSRGAGTDEVTDQAADENGVDDATPGANGIRSQVYDLQPNSEATTDDDTGYTGNLDDDNVNLTADFGFVEAVAIGNRVWLDTGAGANANNGRQDAGELGAPTVDVWLYRDVNGNGIAEPGGADGAPVLTTQTDTNGNYAFDNLNPGAYFVHIPASEFGLGQPLYRYASSFGAGGDETTDQTGDENGLDTTDPRINGVNTQVYNLQPNTEQTGEDQTSYAGTLDDNNVNFTADFGFVEGVALGNRVWYDIGIGTANNGIQDAGEMGVPGLDIVLYRQGDTPGVDALIRATVTDGNGNYVFDNLPPGQYFVFIPPTEFGTGQPLFVYASSFGNGTDETTDQTGDENGIDTIDPATDGIRSQVYDLQPHTERTGEDQASYPGNLIDNSVNFTADFGFMTGVAIGNRVWYDTGVGMVNNGIQDVGEAGVPGLDVELYRQGDTPGVSSPIRTTVTDGNGNYVFDNLPPGRYFVHIPASEFGAGQPLYNLVSSTGYGGDDTNDQNVDENGIEGAPPATVGVSSAVITLQPDSEPTTDDQTGYTGNLDNDNVNFIVDFGFTEPVALGNVLWRDDGAGGGIMNDGILNGGEQGIPGVVVELYRSGVDTIGTPFLTTTTDANGFYLFDMLPPDEYMVHIPASQFGTGRPLYHLVSSFGSGGDDANDDDTDENGIDNVNPLTSGISSVVINLQPGTEPIGETGQGTYTGTLPDNDVNLTIDFGFIELASLGDYVWLDYNRNGIQEPGEPGVPGVTVNLYDGSGNRVKTTTTDANGFYHFVDLLPGNYSIEFIPPFGYQFSSQNQGGNGARDSDANPLTGRTIIINLSPGENDLTWDAGLFLPEPEISPLATPEPTPLPLVTPTPTPTPAVSDTTSVRFGKRREQSLIEKPCVVVPAEIEKPWFITDIAMYAASEMYHTSHPFINWSEEHGLAFEHTFLAPTEVREFSSEILEFSVDNIDTVMANAGIGLHLKYAPLIVAGANAQKMSPEQYLDERLKDFARQSNLKTAPRNPYPLFMEYAEGDPRYTDFVNINDWNTLRWDERSFNKHLIPGAYGQTLLRQVLLLEHFLTMNHRQDGTLDAAGAFLGVDDVKGFLGLLTAEAIVNKLWFMEQRLLYQPQEAKGERQKAKGERPIPYFPYQTVVELDSLQTDKPEIRVVDERSRLWDQLSLLWALSKLMQLTDPAHPNPYQQIFTANLLAPGSSDFTVASVHKLAQKLTETVFMTIAKLHYAPEDKTLIDIAAMRDCQETACPREVVTVDLGLSIVALQQYSTVMSADPDLQQQIVHLIRVAADYLLEQAYDQQDGGFFETITLTPSPSPNGRGIKSLEAQMAGTRGLLAAYQVTQDVRYRVRAFEAYAYAEKELWNADLEVYKDRVSRGLYKYTPLSVGVTIGALRELIYQTDDAQQAIQLAKRMRAFVKQITKSAGLQLSEVITRNEQEFLIPVDQIGVIRTAHALDSTYGLAPVLCAEIRLYNEAITALHAKRPTDSCENARNAFLSTYYFTDIGMYAASEFTLRTLPGNRNAAERDRSPDRSRNAELLNPTSQETFSAKERDFSDYNLTHIQGSSGLGVLLQYGPLIKAQAAAQKMSEPEYLKLLLERYAELAGLKTVPTKLWPIFIEFEGGVPEIEYSKETERWLDQNMRKSLAPSALGQTLVRQTLWLKDALSARHDDLNRISATGKYPGHNAEEGFFGLLVAQAVANKLVFLKETMLTPLKAQTEAYQVPSGRYLPHRFKVNWDGDKPKSYEIEDASSVLFDQASLLWGLSEFKRLAEQPPYTDVLGKDKLIPGAPPQIARELVKIILDNLEVLHWNRAYRTLYDVNTFEEARGERREAKGKSVISTEQAAVAVIALESVYRNFPDEPAIQQKAKRLLLSQVEFIAQYLYRSEDGAVYNGVSLDEKVEPYKGLKTLLAHAAAIRSFLIAYQISGDQAYLNRAKQTFAFLDKTFWDEHLQVYRSAIGGSLYQYTPLNTGMTVGALRELLNIAGATYFEVVNDHLSKFFDHVVACIGLQLSEQRYVLESLETPRTFAPVIAADLTILPLGSATDQNVPQPGSTLTYTIRFMDDALVCDAEDAYIEDRLPEGVTFVRSEPLPVSVAERVIRWAVADLKPDENGFYVVRLEVTVDPLQKLGLEYADMISGLRRWHLNNCASLWCQAPGTLERQVATSCDDTEVKLPQLGIEKLLRTITVEPGKGAEFDIIVTNLSDVTAYTVTITDQLPPGFVYLKDSARSVDVPVIDLDDTDPLVWVLGDLEPKKSIRLTYKAMVDSKLEEGIYQNIVKVHAMDRSGFPFETNEFALDVKVERLLLLNVKQQVGQSGSVNILSAPKAGKMPALQSPFTVMTAIENIGSHGLADGTIVVTLPAGMTYIPQSSLINEASIAEPELKGQTLMWKFGDLPVGVQKTLQYQVTSRAGLAGKQIITTEILGATDTGVAYQSKKHELEVQLVK